MKVTVVVQSKDAFEYLPLFLAHHAKLADRIIVIDHHSRRDLRPLSVDNVEVYRLNVVAYLQAHFLNFFLHQVLRVAESSGMLFVLDVDEFLPFATRADLDAFLSGHQGDAIVSFQWRNGCLERPEQVGGRPQFRFCRHRTPTVKLAYNLDHLGLFYPLGGNHKVKFPRRFWWSKDADMEIIDSGLGLLHLPFMGLEGLRQKLRDNPWHEFEWKISSNYRLLGLNEEAPWWRDNVSEELLLQLVANYRTNVPGGVLKVTPADFEVVQFFGGSADDVRLWSSMIEACPIVEQKQVDNRAIAALKALPPGCRGYVRKLGRFLRLTEGREVIPAS
jgi:hypothetical protein